MAAAYPPLTSQPHVAAIEVSSGHNSGAEGREQSRSDRIQMNLAIGYDSLAGLNCQRIIPASTLEDFNARNCDRLRDRRCASLVRMSAGPLPETALSETWSTGSVEPWKLQRNFTTLPARASSPK